MHSLNNQQQKAIETIDGPILILAGAGTGKTRTLVARIAHLLEQEYAYPYQILAVTFTNKAAKEMKKRITELTNTTMNWIGTFHSIAAMILRKNAEFAHLTSNFTIIDQVDQINLIKNIISNIHSEYIESKEAKKRIKIITNIIQRWKEKALSPYDILDTKGELQKIALSCYSVYQERLRISNAVDFDDLILHNVNIFKNNPEVLNTYHNSIKYIMVDEYQDTNTIQHMWLRLLAEKYKNICCVGDDDQSIYSWRGAEIANILKFSDDFPEAKIIKLEQNYRSTSHILAVAASVISKNRDRLDKTLWTSKNTAEKVQLMRCYDHKEEARNIMNTISKNKKFADTAILVRISSQTRALEEYAMYYGIPYQIIGGLKFYDRKEIKDSIAYLKIANNRNDDVAFERIINTPRRGIGPRTLNKIYYFGMEQKLSLIDSTTELIKTQAIKSDRLKYLVAQINEWHELSHSLDAAELLELVLKSSSYMEMLLQENEIDSLSRKENIKELLTALKDFNNISQFLEYIALVTTADHIDSNAHVSIMTIHAAKGLEFDNVFLPGWEEEIFPHQRCIIDGNVEEERRLAYVAITRAKNNLCISFAERRFLNHRWTTNKPSRFLYNISKKNLTTNFI